MEKKKVSIYTIAKSLNVSPATVSYVVTGRYNKMSLETRQKILDEIERTGYVPDVNARGLSCGKSRLIGLFLPISQDNKSSNLLLNPFYMEFIAAIEKHNRDSGYDLVLGYKNQDDFISWALSRNFDAVIMLGKFPTEEAFKVESLRMPIIFIDVYADEFSKYTNIRSDDKGGMYSATKYLLELGHRKIGYVGTASRSELDKRRYEGYSMALKEYGLEVDSNLLYISYPDFEGGLQIADKIMEDNKVSAIVCSADVIAIGISHKYELKGKKIPDDLSIIGFDDIKEVTYVFPALTTVRQNIEEKGRIVMETLKEAIENENIEQKIIEVKTELIVRNSTKKYE